MGGGRWCGKVGGWEGGGLGQLYLCKLELLTY